MIAAAAFIFVRNAFALLTKMNDDCRKQELEARLDQSSKPQDHSFIYANGLLHLCNSTANIIAHFHYESCTCDY